LNKPTFKQHPQLVFSLPSWYHAPKHRHRKLGVSTPTASIFSKPSVDRHHAVNILGFSEISPGAKASGNLKEQKPGFPHGFHGPELQ